MNSLLCCCCFSKWRSQTSFNLNLTHPSTWKKLFLINWINDNSGLLWMDLMGMLFLLRMVTLSLLRFFFFFFFLRSRNTSTLLKSPSRKKTKQQWSDDHIGCTLTFKLAQPNWKTGLIEIITVYRLTSCINTDMLYLLQSYRYTKFYWEIITNISSALTLVFYF